MDKPDLDQEKGGWILGGIVALAGIIRTYIIRTRPSGGTVSDNMELVYKQQAQMVDRYKAEAEAADKRANDCERERASLFEQFTNLKADVILMKGEIADLREEVARLRGEKQ
jgi:predicted RNase H-like nuclease (RuvC/YqgF family)